MDLWWSFMHTTFVGFDWIVCIFLSVFLSFFLFCFLDYDLILPPLISNNDLCSQGDTLMVSLLPHPPVISFWQNYSLRLKISIPHPSLREIYSLENLNRTSAAIFQPRVEKPHISHLKSNLGFIFGSLIIQGDFEMVNISLLLNVIEEEPQDGKLKNRSWTSEQTF